MGMNVFILLFVFLSFRLLADSEDNSTKIAILGSSQSVEGNRFGLHSDIFTRLLILMKEKKPSAVFFMGDMTTSLSQGSSGDIVPDVSDPYGNNWNEKGYTYEKSNYQTQLDAFSSIVSKTLGKVPFYPVIGFHESLGKDSASLVKQQFDIRNQVDPVTSSLAYSVGIENSFFIVFSTTMFDPLEKTMLQHHLTPSLLSWIEKTLKENKAKYDYFFAVSYEPAFSTTASEGNYKGLDNDSEMRDELWRIFVSNGVTAYFSTAEHLYDRTNRSGIWQIISGGAGAPLHKREFDKAFYHFILLSVPKKKGKLPRVQVFDSQGSLDDAFDLIQRHSPVYQLRISH